MTPEEVIAAATAIAATAAVINLILVAVLVGATIYYAKQTKRTVEELHEARVAESLPVLHWQLHPGSRGAGYHASGGGVLIRLVVLCTNVGPGPARLLDFEAVTDQGEKLDSSLEIPSTLPQRELNDLDPCHFPRRDATRSPSGDRDRHLRSLAGLAVV